MEISGIVLTHNNERTIETCINSLKDIVNELIIIDDYSSDKTIKIIKKTYPKAKIIKHKFWKKGEAYQRNLGIKKAKNNFILMIDSDEIILKNLKKEILKLKNKKWKSNCYYCNWILSTFNIKHKIKMERPIIMNKNIKFIGKQHVQVNYKIKKYLKGDLLHLDWINVDTWLTKFKSYNKRDAEKWFNEKRNYSMLFLFILCTLAPPYFFIKWYIQSKFYKKGLKGFMYSIASSTSWIFKAIYYYELKENDKQKQH